MPKTSMRRASAIAAVIAMVGSPALAGPCADQIAEVARTLSRDPSVGAAVTGSVSGSVRSADGSSTGAINPNNSTTAGAPSLTPGGRTSGEGAVKEMNAASGQVATSPEDVRRQQQGLPTAAQDPAKAAQLNDSMSLAKNKLEEARALDAKNDAGCSAPLNEAKRLAATP